MTREHLIERGALALVDRTPEQGWQPDELQAVTHFGPGSLRDAMRDLATTVIDSVLPLVTTQAQLDRLPKSTILAFGTLDSVAWLFRWTGRDLVDVEVDSTYQLDWMVERYGPATVIWLPTTGGRS